MERKDCTLLRQETTVTLIKSLREEAKHGETYNQSLGIADFKDLLRRSVRHFDIRDDDLETLSLLFGYCSCRRVLPRHEF